MKEIGMREVDTLKYAHCTPKASVRIHVLQCRILKCCN